MTKQRILVVDAGCSSLSRAIAQHLIERLGSDLEVQVANEAAQDEVFQLRSCRFENLEDLPLLDASGLKKMPRQSNFLARKGGHYGAGRKR